VDHQVLLEQLDRVDHLVQAVVQVHLVQAVQVELVETLEQVVRLELLGQTGRLGPLGQMVHQVLLVLEERAVVLEQVERQDLAVHPALLEHLDQAGQAELQALAVLQVLVVKLEYQQVKYTTLINQTIQMFLHIKY